jgi:hypothetical protein
MKKLVVFIGLMGITNLLFAGGGKEGHDQGVTGAETVIGESQIIIQCIDAPKSGSAQIYINGRSCGRVGSGEEKIIVVQDGPVTVDVVSDKNRRESIEYNLNGNFVTITFEISGVLHKIKELQIKRIDKL